MTHHPREDLTALLDGALPADRAAAVRGHVEACDACCAALGRLRAGVAAMAALPPAPALPPFFATRLEARLRAERERPRGLHARLAARLAGALPPRRTLAWAGAAAAAAVLVAGAVRGRAYLEDRSLARDLDLLENYEVASALDVDSPEDAQIVAQLDRLAPAEGTP